MLDHEMKKNTDAAKKPFELVPRTHGTTLVLTGAWAPEAENALLSGEADGLEVNYARGSRERTLDFIGAWPIRWLRIIGRTFRDIDPIYRLNGTLEELEIQTAEGTSVDLARLPRLSSVAADWETIKDTIESTESLRELNVLRFTEPDVEVITKNHGLRGLVLKQAPFLRRLEGVGEFPLLSKLEVYAARTLEDISELRKVNGELESLILESCPSIARLGDITNLDGLALLGFSECREIESIAPVATLRKLEVVHCWGNTRIVDSDLEPLRSLPQLRELRMRDRPDYRPRVSEIQELIGR